MPSPTKTLADCHEVGIGTTSEYLGLTTLHELIQSQHHELVQRLAIHEDNFKRLEHLLSVVASRNDEGGAVRYPTLLSKRDSVTSRRGTITANRHTMGREIGRANEFAFDTLDEVDAKKKEAAHHLHREATKALEDLCGDPFDEKRSHICTKLQTLVSHTAFEATCAILLIASALLLGVETQYQYDNPADSSVFFQILAQLFTLAFAVELLLRFVSHGWAYFYEPWNQFDIVILILALCESVLEVVRAMKDREHSVELGGVSSLRILRVMRITRLVKLLKLTPYFRYLRPFRTLVYSIAYAFKSLLWALLLILLIMYVFGIFFTQGVGEFIKEHRNSEALSQKDLDTFELYWGSLVGSMLTLYMSITGGISWEVGYVPLSRISSVYGCMFVLFISFGYFAVLNVITGVFCQSAMESARSDQEELIQDMILHRELHVKKFKTLFHSVDLDDSGFLTLDEFEKCMEQPEVKAYFRTLELDVEDSWSFFKLLDEDGGSLIDVEEFLMGSIRLRGSASALNMAKLMYDQKWMITQQNEFVSFVKMELRCMNESIANLRQ